VARPSIFNAIQKSTLDLVLILLRGDLRVINVKCIKSDAGIRNDMTFGAIFLVGQRLDSMRAPIGRETSNPWG
jgi:hypothetical protein